jgi:hypothetical protein
MGYGPVGNGKQTPITPWAGSWAQRVNEPIPQRIKDHHADQHATTHTQRTILPGRVDIRGRPLE